MLLATARAVPASLEMFETTVHVPKPAEKSSWNSEGGGGGGIMTVTAFESGERSEMLPDSSSASTA